MKTNKVVKNYYIMTPDGYKSFRSWLICHDLTMSSFAAKCGCSVAYVSMVAKGKKHITKKTRELFLKGGYELI